MRPSINTVHIFEKERNSRNIKPRTPLPSRNPILLDPEPSKPIPKIELQSQEKKKVRQLALGDFSLKGRGTFEFSYTQAVPSKPSKRFFEKSSFDPIKPAEVIPQARFKRPERNPITTGETSRTCQEKVQPHQKSSVFSDEKPVQMRGSKKNTTYKNKSSVFQEVFPEARTQRIRTVTETEEIIQYKFAPCYRDEFVSPKPQSNRYDKGEVRQYEDLKNFASVMREKRNASSIFS